VRLAGIGKKNRAVLVVDNMQSGPDAGRGIAETLAVPHVTLTNFPSEKGYLATVEENVKTVLKVLRK
jgi:zinc transport system substrate-binding protein